MELFLRKVQLHLSLGNRSKFLEASLPLLTEALEVGEATATKLDQAAQVFKPLRKPYGSNRVGGSSCLWLCEPAGHV